MDSLDVAEQLKTEINKKLINIKQPNSEGLLLNIHQSSSTKSVRFIHCDFQGNGNILALANNDAQIYIIDFLTGKYWTLKKLDSCTCIKLSECNEGQILVGKTNGALDVLNIDSGVVIAKLLDHNHPVISISFSQSNICISASKYEALIWDLSNFSKLQVLTLEKQCSLKFVHFVPISNHILICYQDDVIQIWQNDTLKSLKQFYPSNWRNYSVKSITFSRNGKVMIVSGYLPVLAVFQLDIWKLLKVINLPEYINTVKKIQFIPQNFDGGCNRLLAILSGNGIIYFYNIEENMLMSELKSKCEIIKFNISLSNVCYISCLLSSGEVEIYDISFYTMKEEMTVVERAQQKNAKIGRKPKFKNFRRKGDLDAKEQMKQILETDKLKAIVKEYQEFPEAFRASIWERVLNLPNNIQHYNNIVNHVTIVAFEDLYKQFPLEDKVSIRCLIHLLNNIVTWCQFFAHVTFLPYFLFPFVKMFHKKPVACFELCCTIILNWCQHWFEYYPLPPVNILAILDNLLMEHDAYLLKHFSNCNVKPVFYGWSILETAFSEVLTVNQWLQFWDHVFINEPAFLLFAVVAYNILQKKYLMILTTEDEFYQFFRSQNPIDVKRFISKTYDICANTSARNHPRQYLNMFTCLPSGAYPTFDEYPKDVINFQTEHINFMKNQLKEINNLKKTMVRKQIKQNTYSDVDIQNEENRRMIEVEKACIQKIKSYQEALKSQQDQLKTMRLELIDQEKKIISNTQRNLNRHYANANIGNMEILMEGLDMSKKINETELTKLEETHRKQQTELLRKEQNLKEHLRAKGPSPELATELLSAQENTAKLKDQIKKAEIDVKTPRKANVAIAITTMNHLIDNIEQELEKERNSADYNSVKNSLKVHQLEKETKALQKEISQLLGLLRRHPNEEEGSSAWSTQDCNCDIATCTATNKTVRFSTSKN